ncbi:MAG: DNA polymerase III subunit delta [Acidobacteriota bacterium]|nr:DNA polymerase III subunit delta [Acidobacteriota bacterium]HOF83178.1 DNA polymerase III subunit delta [Candidatus Aminicenantes bacterium]MDD8028959.1 DNA polymerase III subunit delta [Acidobacteriota bacterium]MDD8033272.1 DNA polymerase III subunit delta [Acidobacteriota bacterium]MDD8038112.1 DNA polymerase III subunit delta [Acidobacteriota bacterium]
MAGSFLPVPDRPEDVRPAYFFCGEDLYEARGFVAELRRRLAGPGEAAVEVETFILADRRWTEVLDAARNMPFFFSPWRLLIVEGKGAGQEDLSAGEAAAFRDYFASPAPQTTIIVLFEGKIRKTRPLGKSIAALPGPLARIEEIAPRKDREIKSLTAEKFESLGKQATPEAVERILDIAGGEIARIDSEVEKLAVYLGPRRTVEADDVAALCSARSFDNWELTAALEAGDTDKALIIIESLFENGEAPEMILAVLSGFFRTALLAKAGLREGRDPKEVFREAKPSISERFGGFYQRMLGEYLALLGRIKDADLLRWLEELEDMDRRLKSTAAAPKEMIQAFVVGYGRKAPGRRITSPGRR